MAITVDWGAKVINVPQADLTFIGGTLYELDVDVLRLALKDLEDGEVGMPFLDTHRHNTEIIISGVTYARTVEIINGYTLTIEDGQYRVRTVGANHNIADVLNLNQVSLLVQNSAGLIATGGSGLTPTESTQLDELSQIAALDPANPVVHDDAQIASGAIDILVEPNTPAAGQVRLTRQ